MSRVQMVRSARGAEGVQGAEGEGVKGEGAKGAEGAKCTICRSGEWTWCGANLSLKSSIYKSKHIIITSTLALIAITIFTRFPFITSFITVARFFSIRNHKGFRCPLVLCHNTPGYIHDRMSILIMSLKRLTEIFQGVR